MRELELPCLCVVQPVEAVLAHLTPEISERGDFDESRMDAHDISFVVFGVDGDRLSVVRPLDHRARCVHGGEQFLRKRWTAKSVTFLAASGTPTQLGHRFNEQLDELIEFQFTFEQITYWRSKT